MLIFYPQIPGIIASDLHPFLNQNQLHKFKCQHYQYAESLDSILRKVIPPGDSYWDSPLSPAKFMLTLKNELNKNPNDLQNMFIKFENLGGTAFLSAFLNFNIFWQSISTTPEEPCKNLNNLLKDSFGGLQTLKNIAQDCINTGEVNLWFWVVYKSSLRRLTCITGPQYWTPFGVEDYMPLIGLVFNEKDRSADSFWKFIDWSWANSLFIS